jgi:hypothetical protein
MTSLATLTHTAPAPAFNGLFYATTATIIPVLYLAIALQGSTYQDLLRAIKPAVRRQIENDRSSQVPALLALLAIPILIIGFGAFGETYSLIALYTRSANANLAPVVLEAAIFLILAAAAGPLVALWNIGPDKPETGKTDTPPPAPRINE